MPVAPDFSTFLAHCLWELVLLLAKLSIIAVAVAIAAVFALLVFICTGRLPWYVRRYL